MSDTIDDSFAQSAHHEEEHREMTHPDAKRFSLPLALTGFLGGLLVVSLASTGLWFARVIPTKDPRPVDLTFASLPAEVMGYKRVDLEVHAQPASDRNSAYLAWVTASDAAQEPMYRSTYGGDGVEMAYGLYEAQLSITVTAVNGALNPVVPTSPDTIEYLKAVSAFQPLEVPGSPTTTCIYRIAETAGLSSGQSAEQLVADLVNARPASGTVECVRRNVDRNFSVRISYQTPTESTAAGTTATQVASKVAAETDKTWEGLD